MSLILRVKKQTYNGAMQNRGVSKHTCFFCEKRKTTTITITMITTISHPSLFRSTSTITTITRITIAESRATLIMQPFARYYFTVNIRNHSINDDSECERNNNNMWQQQQQLHDFSFNNVEGQNFGKAMNTSFAIFLMHFFCHWNRRKFSCVWILFPARCCRHLHALISVH